MSEYEGCGVVCGVQLIMYPRASNRGIMASDLLRSVCLLAGLKDLGIKIQASLLPHIPSLPSALKLLRALLVVCN